MKQLILFVILLPAISFSGDFENIPSQVRSFYSDKFDQLMSLSAQLNENVEQKEFDLKKCHTRFYEMRTAYKRIEIFAAFFEAAFVTDYINGAPLPHIDRKSYELKILDPCGIQRAEEALLANDAAVFKTQISFLNENLKQLGVLMSNTRFTHQKNYEAMREELIRIAALSITGYDCPGSENAIIEAKASLESVHSIASMYYPYLKQAYVMELEAIFIAGYIYFNQISFEDFDRFGFIKDCINPLYRQLFLAQTALEIPGKELVFTTQYTINYNALNLFDTDLLNHKYYTKYGVLPHAKERADLGRILFFDPVLSGNNQRSCASCHNPEMAFTDGAKKSLAYDGESMVSRNAPTLVNAVFSTRFFHDMRAMTLETQFEMVINNHLEMNSNYTEIIDKLRSSEEYRELFAAIFDIDEPINQYSIAACLSEYIASLRSFNSAFDRAIKGEAVDSLNNIVEGFNLFTGKANCATCHFIPTFSGLVPPLYEDTESEVLGVPEFNDKEKANLDPDKGRYNNKLPRENAYFYQFSFKTPTVRNISLTGPYMHNGIFSTLEEVLEFYDIGGGHAWGIAPEHTTLPPDSLHLTAAEKTSLLVFMRSLTDIEGLTTKPEKLPRTSNPDLNKRVVGGVY